MNSRERVKRAVHFGKPDHVPISHAVLPAAYLKYGEDLKEILTDFRDDFGWDYMDDLPVEDYPAVYKAGQNRDDFNTLWHVEHVGLCGIPVDCPIKDLDSYDEYEWPDVFSAGPPYGRLYSGHLEGFDDRWYARGGWITFWEQLQYLRGLEEVYMDVARQPAALERFMDDMLDFNLKWIDKWIALEYDGLHFADDWGEQSRLLIKPASWRKLFKPRYAEMFNKVRDAGMDVWFHSDGHINDILPDLAEIGVNVVNCQIAVVGYDWFAQTMRGKIAVRTDIDRQHAIPFGTPAMVKETVHRTFEAMGTADGGIIACGEIGPDAPLANIRAMYEAFVEYGQPH